MKVLYESWHVGALLLALAAPVVPTSASAVTVTDGAVVTTQLETDWVTVRPDAGDGISHACVAAFVAGANWRTCYDTFVELNLAAGNRMYQVGGQYRLFENQTYIGPRPLDTTTPAEAAAVVRLGDLLDRANDEELKQLREAVGETGGNVAMLADRLSAFEERLKTVENNLAGTIAINDTQATQIASNKETNKTQTTAIEDLEAFVDPLQTELNGQSLTDFVKEVAENPLGNELGDQTLTEFVEARVRDALPEATGTENPFEDELNGESLTEFVTRLVEETAPETTESSLMTSWLPGILLLLGAALISWLIFGRKKQDSDSQQYATKTDFESLKRKVGDGATKLQAVDEKVAQLEPRIDHTEVVAGTALSLASPLRFTETSDLNSLNHGTTSIWSAVDSKTRKHYVIEFKKNDDGLLEAPILRRAGQDGFVQPFKFNSVDKTIERLRLAHADGRLEECLKHKAKAS